MFDQEMASHPWELELSVTDEDVPAHLALGRKIVCGVSYDPAHWEAVEFGSGQEYDWCFYEAQLRAKTEEARAFAAGK